MNLRRTLVNVSLIFGMLLTARPSVAAAPPAGGTRNVSVIDPIFNMRAYSYTIPDNWIFDGVAVQGSSCAGGVVPVFRAISPDGLVGVKALPHLDWAWSDNPTMAAHDDAADCLPYKKTMTAVEFLQYMYGILHVQFVRLEPVPWLAQRQRETAAQNTPNSQSTIDIAIATVHYKINKITIEEQIQVNVGCHSNLLMGTATHQNSCKAGVIREWAPEGKFAANSDTFKAILHSFSIDQEWQARFTAMMVQQVKDRAARGRAFLDAREAAQNRQMQAQYNAFNQSQQMRQQQLLRKEKPRYDGRCREIQGVRAGAEVAIRFKNPLDGEVIVDDQVHGRVVFQNRELDDLIIERSFERGILFLGCGPSTIRLCPPLVVTKEEADVALDVLEECIQEVGK